MWSIHATDSVFSTTSNTMDGSLASRWFPPQLKTKNKNKKKTLIKLTKICKPSVFWVRAHLHCKEFVNEVSAKDFSSPRLRRQRNFIVIFFCEIHFFCNFLRLVDMLSQKNSKIILKLNKKILRRQSLCEEKLRRRRKILRWDFVDYSLTLRRQILRHV